MRNRTYGGVRGRKTKVGEKLLRFPPTRLSDMTLTWLVQIQPQVFTAKRSERQVVVSNGKDGGSYVTRLMSLRTETWSRLNEMDKPAALISIFKRKFAFPSLDILEHSRRKELLDQSSLGVKPANSLLSDQ